MVEPSAKGSPNKPISVAISGTVTRVEGEGNGVSPGRYRFVPSGGYGCVRGVTAR